MTPETFPEANTIFKAPADWDEIADGPCGDLPVCAVGDGTYISQWRPTWRERISLFLGGSVRLWIVGQIGQPPVSLEVVRP